MTSLDAVSTAKLQVARHLKEGTVDYGIEALKKLGGMAPLWQIYKTVKLDSHKSGRTLPRNYESVIRQTLQAFSSDAKQFQNGRDIFRMAKEEGRGWWALRRVWPES